MDAYKQMYLTLFKAIQDAMAVLEQAQQAAEEFYLEQAEALPEADA